MMDSATQGLYSGQYPLQPLVEKLEGNGYQVNLFDPGVSSDEANQPTPLDSGQTYINVGFSSGAVPAMQESVNNSTQVTGLVLLDPTNDPGIGLNFPGAQYIAYSIAGKNNYIQHYFGGVDKANFSPNINPHTQLVVSEYVAQQIFNFIQSVKGR